MAEKRKAQRDANVCAGISSFTMLDDGSYLEGVAKDVSDGGARIAGEVDGLSVGQKVGLGLLIQGQKVRYTCEIMHIDVDAKVYGLKFLDGPSTVAASEQKVRYCLKCQMAFDEEFGFCGHCGSELTMPRTL